MPELPEVETIRTQLADKLVGRKIVGVEVRLPKIWEGDKSRILGSKIVKVERRAKIIILKLDNGLNIVVHLKMTGQLIYGEIKDKREERRKKEEIGKEKNETENHKYVVETVSFSQGIPFAGFELPAKTTHVVLDLDNGDKLFFNDMRQFGWMKVMSKEEIKEKIEEKMGPEALGEDFTPEYLAKICANWGRPIKLLLLEQSKVAGIGNIYANEALWYAGISPMKRGRELAKEPEKIKKLWEGIRNSLELGIKYGGSSAADEAFVNVLGEKGHMQDHFNVYQKQKTPCPRCGATITVSRLGGRGTFFCPKCQN